MKDIRSVCGSVARGPANKSGNVAERRTQGTESLRLLVDLPSEVHTKTCTASRSKEPKPLESPWTTPWKLPFDDHVPVPTVRHGKR